MSENLPIDQLKTWDVLVGRVNGHWDRASLRIIPFSQVPDRFATGAVLCAVTRTPHQPETRHLLKVLSVRRQGKFLVLDCGLSPEMAQSLKRAELFVHESMRPPLAEGEFYDDQILGMKVLTTDGRDLGEVVEILETPAHDIYRTPHSMIPAVPQHIIKRDFENKIILVHPMPEWDE